MFEIAPESINLAALPSLTLANRKQLPNIATCYLVLDGETVVYVGRSNNLVLRWLGHHKLKQLKSRETEVKIAWIECSDVSLLPSIERALIQYFKPELNDMGEKAMRADYLTRFKLSNDGELAEKAISVRLPLEVDAQVRAMQGQQRSEWLRSAIAEKLERDLQQSA